MNDVNKENWLTTPINKQSFQNVESLFDTIRIKRSSEVPSEIPLNFQSLDSIEIQDIEGNPYPNFELSNHCEIYGDEINRTVQWKFGSDLSKFTGIPIRLRFSMKESDLYSIQFC